MIKSRFNSLVLLCAVSCGLLWSDLQAQEWSIYTPWWCYEPAHVCQLYTDPDSGTTNFRYDCLLPTGWWGSQALDTYCAE